MKNEAIRLGRQKIFANEPTVAWAHVIRRQAKKVGFYALGFCNKKFDPRESELPDPPQIAYALDLVSPTLGDVEMNFQLRPAPLPDDERSGCEPLRTFAGCDH